MGTCVARQPAEVIPVQRAAKAFAVRDGVHASGF